MNDEEQERPCPYWLVWRRHQWLKDKCIYCGAPCPPVADPEPQIGAAVVQAAHLLGQDP